MSLYDIYVCMVGHKEKHPACKKLSDELLAWLSLYSEVQMIRIAYGQLMSLPNHHPFLRQNPDLFNPSVVGLPR